MTPYQSAALTPKVSEQPVLMDCYKRISGRINHAHEAATRIENAIDRILNSQPRPVSGEGGCKTPGQSIESLLNEAESAADGLASRLHDLAARLERAA